VLTKNPLLLLGFLTFNLALASEPDYQNFELPDQAKVALPEKVFSYKSPRVEVKGSKAKLKTPSLSAQDYLFAKETFLTEKREEAIKLLRQELDSGDRGNRDNVLLQLGQLYVEKYMEFSYRESQVYNQQYLDYETQKAAGKKVGAAPKLDNSRSQYYVKEALSVFYRLEKEYPNHPRIDEVIYFIGFVEMEGKNSSKGIKYLERLVKEFPQSRKYDDAVLYLADTYFDRNDFKKADAHYQLLVRKDSGLKDYARYKIAWCELNTGGPQKAVKDMKALILSLGSSPDKGKFSLREQALRDLVVFYSDTGEVDDAVDFFTKAQGKSKALENLKVLAEAYRSKAQDESAIKAYERLIQEFGEVLEAPRWYLGIYECESRLGRSKGGVNRLVELLEKFNFESDWAKSFPEEKLSEKKEAIEMITGEAEKAAFFHHQAGQKSSDKGHYQAAIKLYSSLLKNFPEYPNKKKIAFFRGEALFNQSQWMEASDSYLMAAKLSPKDGLSEEATYNAILSLDNLTSRSKKITKYSKEEAKSVDTTPKDLTVPEEKFIETARYYVKEYPKGKNAGDIMFRIGVIYYQKNQFEKANEEFRLLIKERPTHKTAPTAAHLVLDMYNIRKDYVGLTAQAQAFFQQANLGDGKFKAEMKQIMGEVDFKQIESLEKEDKWNEAGEAYFRFYQNNSKADLAEKALYNSFVSFDKAGNLAQSSEMAKVFVAKYPKSEYCAKMILHLAKAAEKHFDFEQAQRFFLDYSERFPKEKEAKKALYNAAVFSELLEKNKEAQTLYERYLKEGASSEEEQRAIQISLSKIYRKEGNWEKVKTIYRQLANGTKNSEERLKVLAELARIYERAGKDKEKQEIVKEIRSKMDPKKKSTLGLPSFFVAETEFEALRAERESYRKIQLRFPPEVFLATLKKKQKALAKLAGRYDEIVEFGVPDWGVAALFEKGEAYQELVSAFRAVKVPKKYKPEEKAEMESALKAIDEKEMVPVEKAGKEIWDTCAKRAGEFKVVSSYADKCREKAGVGASALGIFPKGKYWSYSLLNETELKKASDSAPALDEKEAYLNYLNQLSARGKDPKLEGLIKQYLYRYPEEKKAVFLLGVEYLRAKKKELASYFFNQLEKDSQFEEKSWIQNNLGMLAWQEKNKYQAQDLFEKAVQDSPSTPYAHLNLGSLYLEGYGFKDSVPLFEKASEALPNNEDAALGWGLALEGTEKYDEARKVYQNFVSENPNATQVLFNYAILLGNRLKQREQAAQIMLRYIQRGGKESARAHEIIKSWR